MEGGEPPEEVGRDEGKGDGDAADAGDGTVVGFTGGVGAVDEMEAEGEGTDEWGDDDGKKKAGEG
jgi:hypothetical protein